MDFSQLWQKFLSQTLGGAQRVKVPPALPPYHAVTVAPTLECCAAARATVAQPILSRSAPRLPLPSCTMPDDCVCRFRKRADRRIGERRFFGASGQNQWSFRDTNKRRRPDRRSG